MTPHLDLGQIIPMEPSNKDEALSGNNVGNLEFHLVSGVFPLGNYNIIFQSYCSQIAIKLLGCVSNNFTIHSPSILGVVAAAY